MRGLLFLRLVSNGFSYGLQLRSGIVSTTLRAFINSYYGVGGCKIIVMQIYKNWLQSHNVQFQETPIGLIFSYQGGAFIISDNSGDELYFQLIMPNIYEVSSFKKTQALQIINRLNREIKCLKATMQDDGHVWLSTEIFVDSTPKIDDFMGRLFSILFAARIKFDSMMG